MFENLQRHVFPANNAQVTQNNPQTVCTVFKCEKKKGNLWYSNKTKFYEKAENPP